MRPAQLGELINAPSLGKVVKKMINQIPSLQLEASIQPLTRGLLRMDLILTPDFQWDQEQHGYVEPFLILVRCSTAASPFRFFVALLVMTSNSQLLFSPVCS